MHLNGWYTKTPKDEQWNNAEVLKSDVNLPSARRFTRSIYSELILLICQSVSSSTAAKVQVVGGTRYKIYDVMRGLENNKKASIFDS